jgi:flagellar biosynthesis activator protein FlaF
VTVANQTNRPYGQTTAPIRTHRGIEYDLLVRVTKRLVDAWDRRREDFPALALAINENTRLWTALALDVAHEDNGLPELLRAQLFYLYRFSEHHGRKVLAGSASVEVLIDINTAVMRGLRGVTGGAA